MVKGGLIALTGHLTEILCLGKWECGQRGGTEGLKVISQPVPFQRLLRRLPRDSAA